MTTRELWLNKSKYNDIIKLSVPLILANAGQVFMQLADTIFVGKYASDAIAAVGMAGMVSWLVASFFVGVVGYTSTIVANNIGASYNRTAGLATWQGIHISIISGAFTAFLSLFTGVFVRFVGHASQIQSWEVEYLNIMLWGSVFFYISTAMSGFFSGKGETSKLMAAQLIGQIANVFLDYAMVFGKWGFPAMGVAGAAWATVISAIFPIIIMGFWFLSRQNRQRFGTGNMRFSHSLLTQLAVLGIPNGIFMTVDGTVWTLFLIIVGRIGTVELASTTIAFRLNTLAFMPVIGMARGLGTLVGQRHGAQDFDNAIAYMLHGTCLAEFWMICVSIVYLFLADWYLPFFVSASEIDLEESRKIIATCKVLLRFVAVYSLGDAVGICLSGSLNSVGDTRWVSRTMGILVGILISLFLVGAYCHWGLNALWTLAASYIIINPFFWAFRLRGGKWKNIRIAMENT